MKILIKMPTRERPVKFAKCIINLYEHIARKDLCQILISADENDETMKAYREISDGKLIKILYGESNNKIHACNRDINEFNYDWDILIHTSDDMDFVRPGFDEIIRCDMRENFPDTDGVLHYNDGFQKSIIMTMSIMGRKYYDRFGYVYHPDYKSLWCDNEATSVARILGKYKYMGDKKILFYHNHHIWGRSFNDALYKRNDDRSLWDYDEKVFNERLERGFDL